MFSKNKIKFSIVYVFLFRINLNKMGIVLADSNDLVRAGLRSIISTQTDLPIVGEVTNNDDLIEQVMAFDTSIVLIDFTAVQS
jgi:DNA-binding NarL/FixJ family response regulator